MYDQILEYELLATFIIGLVWSVFVEIYHWRRNSRIRRDIIESEQV